MGERLDGSGGKRATPPERRDGIERKRGEGGDPRGQRRGTAGNGRRRVHRGLRRPGVAVGAGAARWLYLTDGETIPGGRCPSVAFLVRSGCRNGGLPLVPRPGLTSRLPGSSPGATGNAFCSQALQVAYHRTREC